MAVCHCRAEVWLRDYGWVPVDPADVRKVVLEEKPGLTLEDLWLHDHLEGDHGLILSYRASDLSHR